MCRDREEKEAISPRDGEGHRGRRRSRSRSPPRVPLRKLDISLRQNDISDPFARRLVPAMEVDVQARANMEAALLLDSSRPIQFSFQKVSLKLSAEEGRSYCFAASGFLGAGGFGDVISLYDKEQRVAVAMKLEAPASEYNYEPSEKAVLDTLAPEMRRLQILKGRFLGTVPADTVRQFMVNLEGGPSENIKRAGQLHLYIYQLMDGSLSNLCDWFEERLQLVPSASDVKKRHRSIGLQVANEVRQQLWDVLQATQRSGSPLLHMDCKPSNCLYRVNQDPSDPDTISIHLADLGGLAPNRQHGGYHTTFPCWAVNPYGVPEPLQIVTPANLLTQAEWAVGVILLAMIPDGRTVLHRLAWQEYSKSKVGGYDPSNNPQANFVAARNALYSHFGEKFSTYLVDKSEDPSSMTATQPRLSVPLCD